MMPCWTPGRAPATSKKKNGSWNTRDGKDVLFDVYIEWEFEVLLDECEEVVFFFIDAMITTISTVD